MSSAVRAHNLRPRHAELTVFVACDGSRDRVEVGRPAAARAEFLCSLVKRRGASGTGVNALLGVVLIVFARTWRFSALFAENAELLCANEISGMNVTKIGAVRFVLWTYPCSRLPATRRRCVGRGTSCSKKKTLNQRGRPERGS